jgi:hypothetical protein
MYEKLISRLRGDCVGCDRELDCTITHTCQVVLEAADAIEKLEAERDAAILAIKQPVCYACAKYDTCKPRRDEREDGCAGFLWRWKEES